MKQIKHIFWDLDGIFFRHDDRFYNELMNGLARFIAGAVPDMSFDQALAIARQAQADTGRMFEPFMQRYNFEFEAIAEPSYGGMDLGFMPPNPGLAALIDATPTDHAIITKSNTPWARRILEQVQMAPLFPDSHITACADFIMAQPDFSKAASPLPYQYTLRRHGWLAGNTLMVEDTQKNLKHAKALGITTVLVHSTEPQAEYTDYVFDTAEAFLDYFQQNKLLTP